MPGVLVALLALAVVGGGSAVAAKLINSKDVKDNSLKSADIKNGSLLEKDFKPGQLGAGGAGPAGPQGLQGQAGTDGDDGAPGEPGPSDTWVGFSSAQDCSSANGPTQFTNCRANLPTGPYEVFAQIIATNTSVSNRTVQCTFDNSMGSSGLISVPAGESRQIVAMGAGTVPAPPDNQVYFSCTTSGSLDGNPWSAANLLVTAVGEVHF